MEYELKLKSGKVVIWEGKNGEDAVFRYTDAHRGIEVVAYREVRHGIFLYNPNDLVIG